jgi:hypothetical protein
MCRGLDGCTPSDDPSLQQDITLRVIGIADSEMGAQVIPGDPAPAAGVRDAGIPPALMSTGTHDTLALGSPARQSGNGDVEVDPDICGQPGPERRSCR